MTRRILSLTLLSLAVTAVAAPRRRGADAVLGKTERKILDEINLARTQPEKYAQYVEDYGRKFRGNVFRDGGMNFMTKEGIAAVNEAVDFLRKARPLKELEASVGMSSAAADHARDLAANGAAGHQGSDGSKPSDRLNRHGRWKKTCGENIAFGHDDPRIIVIQLLVDDGVPGRGHRKNLFSGDFTKIGIAVGPHPQYRHLCVMDFAGDYRDKKTRR